MTRKQARRRKPKKKAAWFTMPRIRVGLIVAPLVVVSAVVGTYFVSASILDRPILSIEISGPVILPRLGLPPYKLMSLMKTTR